MLTTLQIQQQHRRRPPLSLRQQYEQYITDRIEDYKNSLTREQILRIGDEAILEMESAVAGQFWLTEALVTEYVDSLIYRRLKLPSFRRWCGKFKEVRAAQREPNHWGLDPASPIARILPRLEPGDHALVLGPGAHALAFLLAAHDTHVLFVARDMTFVDQVESRAASEALACNCATYVAVAGNWPPDMPERLQLVVLDTAELEGLAPRDRQATLSDLQTRTDAGGVHLLLAGEHALAPEAFLSFYADWKLEMTPAGRRRQQRSVGVLAHKPASSSAPSVELPNAHGRRA